MVPLLPLQQPRTGWARCPSIPSIWDTDEGGVGIQCHTGCAREDVLAALGLTEEDVRSPGHSNGPAKPEIAKPFSDWGLRSQGFRRVATYPYRTPEGTVLFEVVRYEHPEKKDDRGKPEKSFLQRRPDGHSGWFSGAG